MVRMTAVATQAQFGEVVGISQPAVSELLSRGVLTEGAPLSRWILEYCANLREVAAGRLAAGDLDLATERAGLAKAQREKIEMQNAVTRRELAPTHLIEEVLARAGTRVAGILDAIPGQIRRRVPTLPGSELDAIALEIAKARNIAAAVSLEDLRDEVEMGEGTNSAAVFGAYSTDTDQETCIPLTGTPTIDGVDALPSAPVSDILDGNGVLAGGRERLGLDPNSPQDPD